MNSKKYTKEFLAPIIKKSKTWAEVKKYCGLKPGGGNHRHIKKLVECYDLDISHFKTKQKPNTKYTKEFLIPLIIKSKSWSDLVRNCGLRSVGGNYRMIQKWVRYHKLDTSHFTWGKKLVHLSSNEFKELVEKSTSVRNLIHNCRIGDDVGANRNAVVSRIHKEKLNTDHFAGQAWNKGLTKETDDRIRKASEINSLSKEKILIENAPSSIRRERLRPLMIESGKEYKCSVLKCGITTWLGKPITLHIDHINGISNDNRLENLRFLCPNCHQQTPTWGNGIK